MKISIREFTKENEQIIVGWIEKLHDYLVGIDPDKRLRRQPKYGAVFSKALFEFLEKGKGKIFIAFDGERPVGFSAGGVNQQSKKNLLEVFPTKLGVISDVYVEEEYRGKGIGKQLLERLEDYLISLGCDSLWLNVVAFNPAHDLYSKLGYRDREIGMFKKIGT